MNTDHGFRLMNDAMRLNLLVRPIVEQVARRDRKLADQLRRSTQSVAGNIAEGCHRRGGHRRERFETAYGSSSETKTWLEMTTTWGYLERERASAAWDLVDKICASLYRCNQR